MKNETVIRATLRLQDLIPAFLGALQQVDAGEHHKLEKCLLPDSESDPWWYSEEADDYTIEIMDILNTCAPEGYYFGAHPGDGSDFGFWEVEDE
jgi:hypothetical protein